MPDEVSFLGLAGTFNLVHDYFRFKLLFIREYSCNSCKTTCFSLYHKGRGKSEVVL